MVVVAFVQGMTASPFNDLLIKNRAETLSEVHERDTTLIEPEEVVLKKNGRSRSKQPGYKENSWDRFVRRNETSTEKRKDSRYILYVAKKDEPKTKAKEETTIRLRFRVPCKELIGMAGVADRLEFTQQRDRFLGLRRDTWCAFHTTYGHDFEWCIAISYQLANLVKDGFLKEYLELSQEESKGETTSMEQTHETLIHGNLNTIAVGFSGGGNSTSKNKRYARAVMSLDTRRFGHPTEPCLCFTSSDQEDVSPHKDDQW